MNPSDLAILRGLGLEVAEIAAQDAQATTIAAWKAHNSLARGGRPMVVIDEVPWHEMDVDGELALRAEDPFCRELETGLRRTLYAWRHMPADMVVEPIVDIPKVIRSTGFGVEILETTLATDDRNEIVSHAFSDQLSTDDDVARIRTPEISLDAEATDRREASAHEVFDGILEVRMQGWLPSYELWDEIVQLRTPEIVLMDLADRPEHMHRIAEAWTSAHLAMLDQLEANGLLGSRQALIHCTGAFTDELPAEGHDPASPRAKDLWTYGMAQIFGSVSPAMHDEFEIPYAQRWYSRFGLGYYGCCDPLHNKIDLVRKIPNVRKISMSPWADVEKGAERIGRDYVFSSKPSPTPLAMDDWDVEAVRVGLRRILEATRRQGCTVELILKDISTVRYQPQRLWEWERIAMDLVR